MRTRLLLKFLRSFASLLLVLFVFISLPVYSEPPPWAPAHGYRHKHQNQHYHKGYEYFDRRVADIIGIFDGVCKYEKIGTIVGGAAGAVIGAEVTSKDDKVAGVIIGTIAGVLVGKTIGKVIDERDRECAGHALAFVENGEAVEWVNPNTLAKYKVTPISSYQQDGYDCRRFVTNTVLSNGRRTTYENNACLYEDGIWRG
jgi:surface antigen